MTLLTRLLTLSFLLTVLVGCTSTAKVVQKTASPPSSAMPTDTPLSPSEVSASNTSPPCPVTSANGSTPPGERPSTGHHGNGALWTVLWPEGKVLFERGGPGLMLPDGSLSMKWPWWRGVRGKLTIEGRRLDAPAPPLRADIPEGYGDTGFQVSGIIFSSEGCWEVTGRVGDTELTFVTLVVKVSEQE